MLHKLARKQTQLHCSFYFEKLCLKSPVLMFYCSHVEKKRTSSKSEKSVSVSNERKEAYSPNVLPIKN